MLITGLVIFMRWPESMRSTFPPLRFSRHCGNSLDGFLKGLGNLEKNENIFCNLSLTIKSVLKKKRKKLSKLLFFYI